MVVFEIQAILGTFSKLGLKATEAAHRIQEIEGNESISSSTV